MSQGARSVTQGDYRQPMFQKGSGGDEDDEDVDSEGSGGDNWDRVRWHHLRGEQKSSRLRRQRRLSSRLSSRGSSHDWKIAEESENQPKDHTFEWAKEELKKVIQLKCNVESIITSELKPALKKLEERAAAGAAPDLSNDFEQLCQRFLARDEFRALFEWWGGLSAPKFVKMIKLLNPDEDDQFLSCLTVEVPFPVEEFTGLRDLTTQPLNFEVACVGGKFSYCLEDLDLEHYDHGEIDAPPTIKNTAVLRHALAYLERFVGTSFAQAKGMKEVNTSFTAVGHLFRGSDEDTEEDLKYLFGSLMECRESIFDTVFVNAFIARIWRELKFDFYTERLMEVVLLVLMFLISSSIRQDRNPTYIVLLLTIMTSWRALARQVLLLCECIKMYGIKLGILQQFSQGSGLTILIFEVFSCGVLCWLCGDGIYERWTMQDGSKCEVVGLHRRCSIGQHPNFMWVSVAFKWVQFAMYWLCTNRFGSSTLPAYYAVIGDASMNFLLFLSLMFVGVAQAYYVFPIEENNDTPLMFMKLYRLMFLGDFDPWEIEGKDPVVAGTFENQTFSGEMDDPQSNKAFHHGILFFIGYVTLLWTVMFMNVYIGVVGDSYQKYREESRNSTLKLRTFYMFQLLQIRSMYPSWLQSLLGLDYLQDFQKGETQNWTGVWIFWDEKAVVTSPDKTDKTDELAKKVAELAEVKNELARKVTELDEVRRLQSQRTGAGHHASQ